MKRLIIVAVVIPLSASLVCYAAEPWTRPGKEAAQQITGPDGRTMVWVPAGQFMMGAKDITEIEKPVHTVKITKGFWIHQCEVNNAAYVEFLNDYGARAFERERNRHLELIAATLRLVNDVGQVRFMGAVQHGIRPTDNNDEFVVKNGRGNYPALYITWVGARAYAMHYNLQLPTEAQWEYAARGPQNLTYPWGNDWDPENCCNVGNLGDGYPKTMPIASIPVGASWCGALAMGGNVSEWCADIYEEDYYSKSPTADPTGPDDPDNNERVLRGGSWMSTANTARCAVRDADPKTYSYYDTGFRCVIVPD